MKSEFVNTLEAYAKPSPSDISFLELVESTGVSISTVSLLGVLFFLVWISALLSALSYGWYLSILVHVSLFKVNLPLAVFIFNSTSDCILWYLADQITIEVTGYIQGLVVIHSKILNFNLVYATEFVTLMSIICLDFNPNHFPSYTMTFSVSALYRHAMNFSQ